MYLPASFGKSAFSLTVTTSQRAQTLTQPAVLYKARKIYIVRQLR